MIKTFLIITVIACIYISAYFDIKSRENNSTVFRDYDMDEYE